jgi:heptose I phosphotransferase
VPSIIEITPVNNIVANKLYKEVLIQNRLDTLKSFLQYANVEIVKQAIKERNTVKLVLDEGHGQSTFFLKRHAAPSVKEYLKLLIRFSWPKSAFNEWRAIIRFHQVGIPTMVPVAAGVKRNSLGIAKQSFVLTREISNAHRLDHYLAKWLRRPLSKEEIQRKRRLIRQLARLTRKMHIMGLNHRDYYLCHIFIRTTEESRDCELFIVDLHRVDIRKKVGNRWIVKDLAALNFSSLDLPIHTTDRMRFFKLYLQKVRLDKKSCRLLRQISKKTKRIARHTEKMYKRVDPMDGKRFFDSDAASRQ